MHEANKVVSDTEWLAQQFEELTTELVVMSPSAWAEQKRYLPASVTSLPGHYRFEVAPYLREIVDCLSVDSPIREVSIMKGVQIGATTGVIENGIGYFIEHVRTAPIMLVTADAELAKLRIQANIIPMLQLSELSHLIKSSDEKNPRKTGQTDTKVEWVGGGFLIPFGARNADKLRSTSIQVLLRDEIDAWPDVVGKDGDPLKLSADRTAAYESSRKIVDISTPLVKGTSKISARYLAGDQRQYFVCCIACGFPQTLRWRRTNPETGEVSGIVWETERGRLVPGSVRYLCANCGHAHTNENKVTLLSPDHGAEWRPTAEPMSPTHRSYHISALYSPVGMQTWEACVRTWLEAWDEEHNRSRDNAKLQVFYNNVLGEAFEIRGERLRFEAVSGHRRQAYAYGQIPNDFALEYCGSPILLLTCAADVHKDQLPTAVFGWTRGRRAFLIDYWRYEGDTENPFEPGPWSQLSDLIENREYVATDGKIYKVQLTLIDSGYRADTVYDFAAQYAAGVAPLKGREAPARGSAVKEFSPFKTAKGTVAYNVTVDLYKDRWSGALRRSWDGQNHQPYGHFNAPVDATDAQLKELTVESRRERIDDRTGKRLGHFWFRPSGSANELWDLLIYNSAALDLIAWDVCINQMGLPAVEWDTFFELAESQRLYFSESR